MGGGNNASTRAVAGELITADDVLPMADLVEQVKSQAWARCCAKAAAMGWPVSDPALDVIRMTPVVALMALARLCPQVATRRLARLLRLEPAQASGAWTLADHGGAWAGEAAAAIVTTIQDGGEG